MADDLRLATQTEATGALRPDIVSGRRRLRLAWLGTLPFFAYALAFLFVPAGEVMVGAFKGTNGGATLHHVREALHQPYLHEYWLTIKVSLITAAGGAVLDTLLPPRCLVCGVMVEVDGLLCPTCWSHLSFIAPPLCDHCGLPFAFQVLRRDGDRVGVFGDFSDLGGLIGLELAGECQAIHAGHGDVHQNQVWLGLFDHREGLLRRWQHVGQERRDMYMYSLLPQDLPPGKDLVIS